MRAISAQFGGACRNKTFREENRRNTPIRAGIAALVTPYTDRKKLCFRQSSRRSDESAPRLYQANQTTEGDDPRTFSHPSKKCPSSEKRNKPASIAHAGSHMGSPWMELGAKRLRLATTFVPNFIDLA